MFYQDVTPKGGEVMLKIGEHVLYYGYYSGAFHLHVFEKEKVDHTFNFDLYLKDRRIRY